MSQFHHPKQFVWEEPVELEKKTMELGKKTIAI